MNVIDTNPTIFVKKKKQYIKNNYLGYINLHCKMDESNNTIMRSKQTNKYIKKKKKLFLI